MATQRYDSLFQRLVANSEKPEDQNENGCWVWTGNTDRKGYGRLAMRRPGKANPTGVRAHRAMHEALADEDAPPLDPDEETIEHLCTTPACINPDHHVVVTRAQNTALMQARKKAQKTFA